MINFSNDWFFETTKALIGSSLLKKNFGFKWFQKIKIGYKSNILKIRAPEKLRGLPPCQITLLKSKMKCEKLIGRAHLIVQKRRNK